MARRSRKKQRVPSLSEDLVLEILSRVPYRSLCRFKCVSRSWLALCSDPDLRKKSPQTLSGFFCFPRQEDDHNSPRFLNLSGRGRRWPTPLPLSWRAIQVPCSWSAAAAFSSGKSGDRLRLSQSTSCRIPRLRNGSCCRLQRLGIFCTLSVWGSTRPCPPASMFSCS
ncbi:hypothetical protein PVAP13_5KG093800 [Panicum virgatum]|uniref:F-box domain-containing protein n=1 Tax=Panicum virgatum TaxID=38727 RepID=A0A8T0SHG6_PANVG|nr:hypothetical protein PVAP13_5KG093800 [Panicum virgatum]KAG2595738.1 hypothetical protein PVAP13_5KG093800 [Panicum virgatum]KAG2595739.1 hypothetical protein PVAP13_5KG093800 [Panicum virgatum]